MFKKHNVQVKSLLSRLGMTRHARAVSSSSHPRCELALVPFSWWPLLSLGSAELLALFISGQHYHASLKWTLPPSPSPGQSPRLFDDRRLEQKRLFAVIGSIRMPQPLSMTHHGTSTWHGYLMITDICPECCLALLYAGVKRRDLELQ